MFCFVLEIRTSRRMDDVRYKPKRLKVLCTNKILDQEKSNVFPVRYLGCSRQLLFQTNPSQLQYDTVMFLEVYGQRIQTRLFHNPKVSIPIILGRPLNSTSCPLNNVVEPGLLTQKEVVFNHPDLHERFFRAPLGRHT